MSKILLLLQAKYRIANNALAGIRSHLWFHLFVGLGLVFVLIGGGTTFFYELFDFLMKQPLFGPPLMDRLVGLVLLAFFSMLTFSNLIITLSTTYISREVEFLIGRPLAFRGIFHVKLIESILYSSWAFAILSFPLFMAYGITRDVDWFFYPLALLLVIPFLVIPAGLGSILTLVIAAFLPARRGRTLSIALGAVSIVIMVLIARAMGFGRLLATAESDEFLQVMGSLNVGAFPFLPNYWLARGLGAIGPAVAGEIQLLDYFYWLALLTSTALFLLQVCHWLVPPLYYRGWCLAKESASVTEAKPKWTSPLTMVDRLLAALPRSLRALVSKDVKTFWRDPAQWTQLIILFGLLVIYVANLRSASGYSRTFELLIAKWRTLISFFNLAATCFILSILTTRFVYPLLSLEGKQFWIVGLAPIRRSKIVWEKYWLCFFTALAITESVMMLSNVVLGVPPYMRWLSVITVLVMAFALTSLSVGLGALTPNFKEDNPARIANGLGGTMNVILSLIYIGATIVWLMIPAYHYAIGNQEMLDRLRPWIIPYLAVGLLFQVLTISLPMALGLRKWNRMEF